MVQMCMDGMYMFTECRELFEEDGNIVFVTEYDTHVLAYVNKIGRELFSLEEDGYQGRPCWAVFWGKCSTCGFCNSCDIRDGEHRRWSMIPDDHSKYYDIEESAFTENDRRYRILRLIDMSKDRNQSKNLRKVLRNEKIINEALRIAMEEEDPERSISRMLESLGKSCKCDRTYIFEVDEDGKYSNTYEWCNKGVAAVKDTLQGLDSELLKPWNDEFDRNGFILIPDLDNYEIVDKEVYDILEPQNIKTLVCGPLALNNDRRIGFYGMDNPHGISLENIPTMYEVLGHFISALLRHRDNVKKLENLSYYDSLTGLMNRRALDGYLDKCDMNSSMSYFFLDINGLKKINDLEGHSTGDRVIEEVGDLLTQFFGNDPVVRMGGDEFMALAPGVSREKTDEMKDELKEKFSDAKLSVAIGSVWKPDLRNSLDEIYREVDRKMYEDKQQYYHKHGCR